MLEQHSEKTTNIIDVLGTENSKVGEKIKNSLGNMGAGEITKMLTLKGMKKAEINAIIEKNRIM